MQDVGRGSVEETCPVRLLTEVASFQTQRKNLRLISFASLHNAVRTPRNPPQPAVVFEVDVTFGQHCFSRGLPRIGTHDTALECIDSREIRLFDFDRWKLSKSLPGIIQALAQRKCHQTGEGNFFTIEVVMKDGKRADYDVFFVASKSSRKGYVNLFVQSAYIREKNKQPFGKPIRFLVVLHNTLNRRPIKA